MYIYIYIYIYIYTYIHVYIYIYVYIHMSFQKNKCTRETVRLRFNYSIILNMQGNERWKTCAKVREQ